MIGGFRPLWRVRDHRVTTFVLPARQIGVVPRTRSAGARRLLRASPERVEPGTHGTLEPRYPANPCDWFNPDLLVRVLIFDLFDEMTHAENWLQGWGHLRRQGDGW